MMPRALLGVRRVSIACQELKQWLGKTVTIDEIDHEGRVKCKMESSWAKKAQAMWLVPGALTRDIKSMKDSTTALDCWHRSE